MLLLIVYRGVNDSSNIAVCNTCQVKFNSKDIFLHMYGCKAEVTPSWNKDLISNKLSIVKVLL